MPSIDALQRRIQQMAAITALFAVEYGEPRFAFYPKWAGGTQVGAIKNGSGDELFCHFTSAGCFIKGFAHESSMTPYRHNPPKLWPGLLDGVPSAFEKSLKEPAFDIPATTFVIWQLANGSEWLTGRIDLSDDEYKDGSADLLEPLSFTHIEFTDWLEENYEVEVDGSIVESVFNNRPLSEEEMLTLNHSQPLRVLRDAVRETGYSIE
ncbi:hypothetical protein [Bremerella sp.]|uniref:hypothetical protein n=1 Tax=Bremerella sp. TaxID=2795602 RepID=UPI00391DB1FE